MEKTQDNNKDTKRGVIIEPVEDGVRVAFGDEDFVIALHDENHEKWDDAREKYQLPTLVQAHIIAAFIDRINETLKGCGGDSLEGGWYWIDAECTASYAWFYYGTGGTVLNFNKYYRNGVRPVHASA